MRKPVWCHLPPSNNIPVPIMLAFTTQTNLCSFFLCKLGHFRIALLDWSSLHLEATPYFFLWSVEISSKVNEIKTFITLLKLILNLTFSDWYLKVFIKIVFCNDLFGVLKKIFSFSNNNKFFLWYKYLTFLDKIDFLTKFLSYFELLSKHYQIPSKEQKVN